MPMIKTKKKKHGKIVLLAESKLNNIEVLISNALIDEFVVINNVLKEYDKMKEKIKDSSLFIKKCYLILWSVEKIQKVKIHKL